MQWIQRGFIKEVSFKSQAAAAFKILGKESNAFIIKPGQKITMVCALSSNFKTTDCLQLVKQEVNKTSLPIVENARKEHKKWWQHYWNESYVSIGESVIEHQYYRSQCPNA